MSLALDREPLLPPATKRIAYSRASGITNLHKPQKSKGPAPPVSGSEPGGQKRLQRSQGRSPLLCLDVGFAAVKPYCCRCHACCAHHAYRSLARHGQFNLGEVHTTQIHWRVHDLEHRILDDEPELGFLRRCQRAAIPRKAGQQSRRVR